MKTLGLTVAAVAALCGVVSAAAPEWNLTLCQLADGRPAKPVSVCGLRQRHTVETLPGGIRRFTYGTLAEGDSRWSVTVVIDERVTPTGKTYAGRIENRADDVMVTAFDGPFFGPVATDPKTTRVYLPDGLGRRVTTFPTGAAKLKPLPDMGAKQRNAPVGWYADAAGRATLTGSFYPSRNMSMQFFAADFADGQGLYAAAHDPDSRTKRPLLRHDGGAGSSDFGFGHRLFLRSGQAWVLPETVFERYTGDWHTAARRYRRWYDGARAVGAATADWAKKTTGQLLVIMKQQNEALFWPYTDLPKLCDVAEANGLDTIGLFGWTKGGHDHLYPDYDPDPKMGGVEALKAGIAEAHRRGIRVYIYANGQLQQVGATDFWTRFGKDNALTHEDGTLVIQNYHKYADIPKYDFALGCLWAKPWHDRMLALAHQAEGFGADGILYDQLGIFAPFACWGKGHGHAAPGYAYAEERPAFLRRITDAIRAKNPRFAVLTEGLHDTILDSISAFHGCETGTYPWSLQEIKERGKGAKTGLFPELWRYTFPELVTSTRVPSPMSSRTMANYTAAFGMRHDIELRYAPDRAWALEGKVPTRETYGTVVSKPSPFEWLERNRPQAAAGYLKAVNLFQRKHAKYLLTGRFVDDEGFAATGGAVIAKRYVAADGASAVLVWNIGDQPAAVRVAGLGEPTAVAEPEKGTVAPAAPLAADTLRLYVFGK